MIFNLFVLISIARKIESFERRYIPESNELEKNIVSNSIGENKNKFWPKFDANNLVKNRKYFHELFNLEKIASIKKKYELEENIESEKLPEIINKTIENELIENFNNSMRSDEEYSNIISSINHTLKAKPKLHTEPNFIRDIKTETIPSTSSVFSTKALNSPQTITKPPIFFTNPVTGIVYAITEVGYNYTTTSSNIDSNSIPIYIPKEQYDRDMRLLKFSLKKECPINGLEINGNKTNSVKDSKKKKLTKKKNKKKQPGNFVTKIKKTKVKKRASEESSEESSLDSIRAIFNDVYDSESSSEENIDVVPQGKKKILKNRENDTIDLIPTITSYRNSTIIQNNVEFGSQMENPKKYLAPISTTTMTPFTNRPLKRPLIANNSWPFYHRPIHKNHQYNEGILSKLSSPLKIEVIRNNETTIKQPYYSINTPINKLSNRNVNSVFSRRSDSLNHLSRSNATTAYQLIKSTYNEIEPQTFSINKTKPTSITATQVIRLRRSVESDESFIPIPQNFTASDFGNRDLILRSKSYITPPIQEIRTLQSSLENEKSLKKKLITKIHLETELDDQIFKNSKEQEIETTTPLKEHKAPCENSTSIPTLSPDYYIDKSAEYNSEDDYVLDFDDLNLGDGSYEYEESDEKNSYEINAHRTRKASRKKQKKQNIIDEDDGLDLMDMFRAFIYPFQVRYIFQMYQLIILRIILLIWQRFSKWIQAILLFLDMRLREKIGPFFEKRVDLDDDDDDSNRTPKLPQYTTLYDKFEDNQSGYSSWFNWFGFGNSKKNEQKPSKQQGWFDWIYDDYDERSTTPTSSGEENDADNWLSSWFNFNSGLTNSTSAVPSTTHTPILTIANPMKNPHQWIGILAQHIVNSTGSSTVNPLLQDYEPKKITYNKYQLWRLKPLGEIQVKTLEKYKNSEEGAKLQWLSGPSLRGLTDVLVPPKLLTDIQGTLNYEDIPHEVVIYNVGKAILFENSLHSSTKNTLMSLNHYKTYDEIIRYIENIQVKNPDYVELFHIGRSYEGRPLVIVKVSLGSDDTKKQKLKEKKQSQNSGVFIEAGIYGREWITPASALWLINKLISIMKDNSTSENEFIQKSSFFIMPVLNPDGYQFSHDYDRFWRKSRSRNLYKPGILTSAIDWIQKTNSEKLCFGVDLDQNWEYGWGTGPSGTKLVYSDFFGGLKSFSEPETKALSKFLMDYRKRIKLFISFQSYGQVITYPTKINTTINTQRMEDLLDVAMVGTDALRKSGRDSRYKIDSSNDLIPLKSGSSSYYAMYEIGIPFAYTIYLGDNGVHGYLLPNSFIESTSKDVLEIIKGMVDYVTV